MDAAKKSMALFRKTKPPTRPAFKPLITIQVLLLSFCITLPLSPAQAAEALAGESGRVHSQALAISGQLELIRAKLGKPKPPVVDILVTKASSLDIYFQSLILFDKINTLSFERTRTIYPDPSAPKADPSLIDVLRVLDAILELTNKLAKELGAAPAASIQPGAIKQSGTEGDIFLLLANSSRQAGALLETKAELADVFLKVTGAVGYAARTLEIYPDVLRLIPSVRSAVTNPKPADVYMKLVNCLDLMGDMAPPLGLIPLRISVEQASLEIISTGDLLDMASLVRLKTGFLHSLSKEAKPEFQAHHPGPRSLRELFERVLTLETQLAELEKQVDAHPERLLKTAPPPGRKR
ncbi:MAG: hypothetical protein HY751_01460 [Nitrospinae bacterium]|nr:hypothetical protein [Nitrospinota bacterium]